MPTHGAQQRAQGTPHWSDHARYEKARRLRLIEGRPLLLDSTGTHRRLRALMAIGWRARDLAPRIGWASGELDALFRRPTVTRRVADAVNAVYVELSDTPGPSEQTRGRATRAGWLPPIAWDDDTIDDRDAIVGEFPKYPDQDDTDTVVIDRYLAGDRTIRLNRAEKREVFHTLRARGHTLSAACTQLRLSGSTGRRYEAARTASNVIEVAHTAGTDCLEETG